MRRAVLAGLVALVVAALPAAAAPVRLTVSPARVEAEVPAGGTGTFPIQVTNGGETPLPLLAYAWDLWHGPDGYTYAPPGTTPRSATSWVAVVPRQTVVAPGATTELLVTLSPPPDLEGGHYATVFVQTGTPADTAPGATEIHTPARIGVQVLARIEGTGAPDLAIEGVELAPPTPTRPARIRLRLHNRGDLHATPEFRGLIRTPDGDVLGRVTQPPMRPHLPDQRLDLELTWSGELPPGAYELVGSLLYGDDLVLPLVHPFLVDSTGADASREARPGGG